MDIVKRLKQEPPSYTMDFDAADTIERLRAELAECKQDLRSISDALDDPRCDLTHTMAELISEFRADAQRLLWLTEDHPDQATRKRIRAICESIPVRSLSNLRLNIDEARKGEEEA